MPKNTGTPGIPRNVGIQFARGKYIAFLDSDDLYTKTALEEITTLAEKYQADVVHMNDSYKTFKGQTLSEDDPRMTNMDELLNSANYCFSEWRWPMPRSKPIDAPTLMPDTLEDRLKILLEWKYRWGMCSTFCRREFLIINQICFSDIPTSEDVPFCFECMCMAKNCLQVPNVVYIIRTRNGSASHEDLISDFTKHFARRVKAFNDVFNEFERIMDKIPFFTKQINFRYAVLNWFADIRLPFAFQSVYMQIPAFKLNDLVKKEFHPDDAALAAYMFNTINVYRLQLARLQQENFALKKELQQYRSAKVQ